MPLSSNTYSACHGLLEKLPVRWWLWTVDPGPPFADSGRLLAADEGAPDLGSWPALSMPLPAARPLRAGVLAMLCTDDTLESSGLCRDTALDASIS